MARDKAIRVTRESNFPEWYQQVLYGADWVSDSPTKGCLVIKPNAYGVWEQIQQIADRRIKEFGVKNAYFPLFIPQSLLCKEAEHVEGFATECAVVTHSKLIKDASGKLVPAGKLDEPLIVRPTSETIMYEVYSSWVKSFRDLPLLINQWCNVVRWELRTRAFLRTLEFLWQEGHCCHTTHEESLEFTLHILHNLYEWFMRDYLAIPVIAGAKPQDQKFPGAVCTYTVEGLMQDNKALQMATSHDLGQNFSKESAFNIGFMGSNGERSHAWQNSWGMTTRLLGATVMCHGDDDGIVLPPYVAPTQVVFVPIVDDAEAVCKQLAQDLRNQGLRCEVDSRDETTGFKYHDHDLRGTPLRVEIGKRELSNNTCTVVTRLPTLEEGTRKIVIYRDILPSKSLELLKGLHLTMYTNAQNRLEVATRKFTDYQTFVEAVKADAGFAGVYVCSNAKCSHTLDGKLETEDGTNKNTPYDWIKAHTSGATGRVIPNLDDFGPCIRCGDKGVQILFAKAY